uniref:Uncharacterized protein n=1 Tax=Cucumis melo TaxID=3656 RepID=A0A9I9CW05_CUCME
MLLPNNLLCSTELLGCILLTFAHMLNVCGSPGITRDYKIELS